MIHKHQGKETEGKITDYVCVLEANVSKKGKNN